MAYEFDYDNLEQVAASRSAHILDSRKEALNELRRVLGLDLTFEQFVGLSMSRLDKNVHVRAYAKDLKMSEILSAPEVEKQKGARSSKDDIQLVSSFVEKAILDMKMPHTRADIEAQSETMFQNENPGKTWPEAAFPSVWNRIRKEKLETVGDVKNKRDVKYQILKQAKKK